MGHKKRTPLAAVRSIIQVHRAAQRERPDAFAKIAFDWLKSWVPLDRAVIVTSLRGATWVDAHFFGIDDPRGLMESHDRVRHLDPTIPRIFEKPNLVHRFGHDDPENRGARLAPFREHLERYGGRWILVMAVPDEGGNTTTVLMAIRGWESARRFSDDDARIFDAVAPHLVEAFAMNRTAFLGTVPPVASIDSEGRFLATTPAFVRLFWPDEPPGTAYLRPEVLTRVKRSLPWPLPGGEHTLHASPEEGGYLLRLRSTSPADRLSRREREIAAWFARGATYKAIAKELSLSPTTVRNHLQNLYAKLGVTQRDELRALLARP